MPAAQDLSGSRGADAPSLDALSGVSEAVEAGAGLPEVARAARRALNASVVVVDSSSSVLAVACASPQDEQDVLAGRRGSRVLDLRVAEAGVGKLHYRPQGEPPPAAHLRMVATLIALEVDRARGPERASEAALAAFLGELFDRRVTDRENIVARANELGANLAEGGSVIVVRARPQRPEEGDWRARVLAVAERGARAVARGSLAAQVDLEGAGGRAGSTGNGERAGPAELVVLVPGAAEEPARRAAAAVGRELEGSLPHYAVAIGRSRPAADPVDLHRAGAEALLAANVAEARDAGALAFEETGTYRLLLPAMSEDPAELRRFHEETVAPLAAYDEQYETELVRTVETFLEADGNVARTAQTLFTHRHTVRYRLERVRELTGLDVSSTDGRERLSLGLKAMRVLGVPAPHGPATEPGAEGGRVPR